MPRVSRGEKWKLRTRDKRKKQTYFDHDPDVLTVSKIREMVKKFGSVTPAILGIHPELAGIAEEMTKNAAKMVNDIIAQAEMESGAHVKWSDEDDSEDDVMFPTTFDPKMI
jgi:hypothetical protein